MSAEHERLMSLVAPLLDRHWVFLPTTLAAPTDRRIVDALFGIRTRGDVEDNIQVWERWATASRLRRSGRHETQVWHRAGRIEFVVRELLALPED